MRRIGRQAERATSSGWLRRKPNEPGTELSAISLHKRPPYSSRSACIGSTRDARRAGA
jgi:hypothetical protein